MRSSNVRRKKPKRKRLRRQRRSVRVPVVPERSGRAPKVRGEDAVGDQQQLALIAFNTAEIGSLFSIIYFRYEACSLSDRKSTRLNSSHVRISYAVFCLKKKKKIVQ